MFPVKSEEIEMRNVSTNIFPESGLQGPCESHNLRQEFPSNKHQIADAQDYLVAFTIRAGGETSPYMLTMLAALSYALWASSLLLLGNDVR